MSNDVDSDLRATVAELKARVEALEDDLAIRDLLARYGYMMDTENFEGFVNLYTSDARIDLPTTTAASGDTSGTTERDGRVVWSGKDGIRTFTRMGGPDHLRMHLQGNNVVTHVDGDEAVANAYQVSLTRKDGVTTIVVASNNQWKFRKVDGRWLIQERRAAYLGDDYYAHNLEATPE
jgi:3-phenylpropionate/cinnamic acid dioxygenase small subunit